MPKKNVFLTRKFIIASMLTLGGILLVFALFHNKSNETISEWVPVNASLEKVLQQEQETSPRQAESRSESKSETIAEPKTEKSEPKTEPKTEKSEPKTEPKSEPKSEPKTEPKSETIEESQKVPSSDVSTSPKLTSPAASEQPDSHSALIDLNHATQAELETLPGIGPSKALAIISYRDEKSGFSKVEQLLEVKGIGPKMLERISALIRVTKLQ